MYEQARDQQPSPLPSSIQLHFKSYLPGVTTQADIEDELCLPLSYQFMFDKRTSPYELKLWVQEELNNFKIQPEMIDRLYHMIANEEDDDLRSWEICCRLDYKGEKYFVVMCAHCDYTGFDCQGGGYICITKIAEFFLESMVAQDQNPSLIYKALLDDGYSVQEPDPLHKIPLRLLNNVPMLKYLCHLAIYNNKNKLSHYEQQLPNYLALSVREFIILQEWRMIST